MNEVIEQLISELGQQPITSWSVIGYNYVVPISFVMGVGAAHICVSRDESAVMLAISNGTGNIQQFCSYNKCAHFTISGQPVKLLRSLVQKLEDYFANEIRNKQQNLADERQREQAKRSDPLEVVREILEALKVAPSTEPQSPQ